MTEPQEEMTLLQRVQAQHKSPVAVHRLLLARKIPQLVEQIGFADSSIHIIPILDAMTDDQESGVRQSLCEQLAPLGAYLVKHGDEGYQILLNDLLRLCEKLLLDGGTNVRDAALIITLELTQLLQREHLASHVLPIVQRLADSADQEDYRVEASHLLNSLAPMMTCEQILSFSIPIIERFSHDPMFRVRKGVASNVNHICQVIGSKNVTELFLPIFIELSADEIWGVRKACCDSLVAFSTYVEDEQRTDKLVPMFNELFADSSRWVKSAALLQLGPFIATFTAVTVAPTLLDHYKSMLETEDQNLSLGETDYVTNCAFNFPAVLQTIGAHRWSELEGVYAQLVSHQTVKVRRTLAFSLHVVANILGTELSEKILLSTFEAFFTDLDEVKRGVLKNMSKFLEILSLPVRKRYLSNLESFCNAPTTKNWRQRRLIAKQMGSFASIFDCETVGTVLLPILKRFLSDPVAAVRTALLVQIPRVLSSLTAESQVYLELLNHLKSLTQPSTPLYQKIWFCKVCPYLAEQVPPKLFNEYFTESLVALSKDQVTNTKIFAADAITKVSKQEGYGQDQQLQDLLALLQEDKDRDVALNAGKALDTNL